MTPIIILTVLSLLVIVIAVLSPKRQPLRIPDSLVEKILNNFEQHQNELFHKMKGFSPVCQLRNTDSADAFRYAMGVPPANIPSPTKEDISDIFGKVKVSPKPLMGTLLRTAWLPTNRLGMWKEAYVDVRRVKTENQCRIDDIANIPMKPFSIDPAMYIGDIRFPRKETEIIPESEGQEIVRKVVVGEQPIEDVFTRVDRHPDLLVSPEAAEKFKDVRRKILNELLHRSKDEPAQTIQGYEIRYGNPSDWKWRNPVRYDRIIWGGVAKLEYYGVMKYDDHFGRR